MAHVIIPTKSNIQGLMRTVPLLMEDPNVLLTVVADGPRALDRIHSHIPSLTGSVLLVNEGEGIHRMWNMAMDSVEPQHTLFLNDDVEIDANTITELEAALDRHPSLGLVCPQYTDYPVLPPYQKVTGTCGGRYDGTGGLAGFCMMLRKELSQEWRFDERMKWWCGDDDVLNWVHTTKGYDVGITPFARCKNNTSWTISNDPPANFHAIVAEDLRIYHSKTY